MAKFEYDDSVFSDLTPEEFQRVKEFGDRMLKEAFAQKGKKMETIELKRCPFCGAQPHMNSHDYGYWVTCIDCGGQGDVSHDRNEAAAAWNRRVPATEPAPDEFPTFQQVSDAELTDDEIDTILTQKPLLTYLATHKAELEWSAEKASHMDDDKNLRRYRAEIADLDRFIESVKSLVRAVMLRPLPPPAGGGEREALRDALEAWAADEDNVMARDEYGAYCIFPDCRALQEPDGIVVRPHVDSCLHLRARALRGDDE